MSDTYDTDTLYSDSPDDSPVIKEMRAKLRAEAKRAKELEARLGEVEAAAQTRRADAAEQLMNALGFPGLKEDILNWVEGDLTEESVKAALQARSLVKLDTEQVSEGTEPQDDAPKVSASIVGQRVADAAGGQDRRDLDTRIAEAASESELASIMAEAGLNRSHS